MEHRYNFRVTYREYKTTQGMASEYAGKHTERIDIVVTGDEWSDWIEEHRMVWDRVTKEASSKINGQYVLDDIELL